MRIERAVWGVTFVLVVFSAILLIQFRMGEDKTFGAPEFFPTRVSRVVN